MIKKIRRMLLQLFNGFFFKDCFYTWLVYKGRTQHKTSFVITFYIAEDFLWSDQRDLYMQYLYPCLPLLYLSVVLLYGWYYLIVTNLMVYQIFHLDFSHTGCFRKHITNLKTMQEMFYRPMSLVLLFVKTCAKKNYCKLPSRFNANQRLTNKQLLLTNCRTLIMCNFEQCQINIFLHI